MRKIQAKKSDMRQNYRILSVGYCDMQYLLKFQNPVAYSAGVNGWDCDYYEIDGVVICTGYNPIKSKNMIDDYKLIREYEQKAGQDITTAQINELLYELIGKLKKPIK